MSWHIVARRAPLTPRRQSMADFWDEVGRWLNIIDANVGFGGPDPTGEDFPHRLR